MGKFSSPESNDPEFDSYERHFASMETAVEKLLKDTKSFTDGVNGALTAHIWIR